MKKAEVITQYWECSDGCCLNDRTMLYIDGKPFEQDHCTRTFSNSEEAVKELVKMLGVELEIKEEWDND